MKTPSEGYREKWLKLRLSSPIKLARPPASSVMSIKTAPAVAATTIYDPKTLSGIFKADVRINTEPEISKDPNSFITPIKAAANFTPLLYLLLLPVV